MIPKSQWRILLVWSILQQRSKITEIILKTTSWFQYVYVNITSIIIIYLLLLLSLLSLLLLLLYIIYIIAILLYDIILLYYTVLHYIILYYVILCYIMLYYVILYYKYIYIHIIYIIYYNSSLVDSNISSLFRSSQLAQAPDQHHSRSPSLHRSPGTAWLEGCWSSLTVIFW